MPLPNDPPVDTRSITAYNLTPAADSVALSIKAPTDKDLVVTAIRVHCPTAEIIEIVRFLSTTFTAHASAAAVTPVAYSEADDDAETAVVQKHTTNPTTITGTERILDKQRVAAAGSYVWDSSHKWMRGRHLRKNTTDYLFIRARTGGNPLDISVEYVRV